MTVERLSLRDFRNFAEADVELAPGVNVIRGRNAQGKTNLLEALFYLSALRPIRPAKDRELIRQGCAAAKIEALSGGDTYTALLDAEGRRKLSVNKLTKRTNAEFVGGIKTVLFSPDELFIVKSGSGERRKLINTALCQLRPAYAAALAEYGHVLEAKNRVLKEPEGSSMLQLVPVYNERLAELGAKIISSRAGYVKQLAASSAPICAAVSGGEDALSLRYRTVSAIENPFLPAEELKELLSEHQRQLAKAELAARVSLSGPHRDELEISVNGLPAKTHASQGQMRTAALALKLAEREIFFRVCGEFPVLLLDDVLSELDDGRKSFVLNRIGTGQVIITTCENADSLVGKNFAVENGHITAISRSDI